MKKVAALHDRIDSLRQQQHSRTQLPRVATNVGNANSAFTNEDDFHAYASFRQNLGVQTRICLLYTSDAADE